MLTPSRTELADGLVPPLQRLGYVDGKTVVIDWRTPASADELVRLKVDVIVAYSSGAAYAAQQATQTIPVVFLAGDPVAAGLVQSLARPGGNLTGVSLQSSDLAPKHLQLLREMVPQGAELGVILAQANASHAEFMREAERTAPRLGFRITKIEAGDIDAVIARLRACVPVR
jgi:putative ABC transport system substrate-binding protein